MIHSICPINVCTDFEINRYKIVEFRKHEKIVCYLTSRDAKTVRRTSWGLWDTSDRYFDQEHLKPIRSLYDFQLKSYGSNIGFQGFCDLDL